jgi:hypothetical protein
MNNHVCAEHFQVPAQPFSRRFPNFTVRAGR